MSVSVVASVVPVALPFEWVVSLAQEFGAVEVLWRESEVSFSGFVAEVWLGSVSPEFGARISAVVCRSVRARCVSSGPAQWCLSVPCLGPSSGLRLSGGARAGRRVRCRVTVL